jgi:hypothetical protein
MNDKAFQGEDGMEEAPIPSHFLLGHPAYPDTEVAVHKREGDTVLVSAINWHYRQAFWVGAQYVKEIDPLEAPIASTSSED